MCRMHKYRNGHVAPIAVHWRSIETVLDCPDPEGSGSGVALRPTSTPMFIEDFRLKDDSAVILLYLDESKQAKKSEDSERGRRVFGAGPELAISTPNADQDNRQSIYTT